VTRRPTTRHALPHKEILHVPVTNLAFSRARPGQTQVLGSALSALVDPTRAETDCLNYDLHGWKNPRRSERYFSVNGIATIRALTAFDWIAGLTSAMSAIASRLVSTNAPVRLKVIDSGTALEAADAFSAGKVDLAVFRSDVGDLSQARCA
jgi:hypothetical protein